MFLNRVFQNKYASTTSCLLALLLFFLPFVELKCKKAGDESNKRFFIQNDLPPATMTGFGMMTGKVQTANSSLMNATDLSGNLLSPQWLVIIAFFVGVIALIFSLINFKERSILIVAAGTLAAICLLIVRFQFKSNIDPGLHLQRASTAKQVEISFKVWFYLAIACFAATAYLAYQYGLVSIKDRFEFEGEPEPRYRSQG